jgi:hypothetical protein
MKPEASGELAVKPWIVAVQGFGEYTYYAASRGKALAQAWASYVGCYNQSTFGEFLKRANAYAGVGNDRFGEAIQVAGLPAYLVSWNRQYIQFVRPGSDVIHNSHPLDVEPPEARRGTPYYVEPRP